MYLYALPRCLSWKTDLETGNDIYDVVYVGVDVMLSLCVFVRLSI